MLVSFIILNYNSSTLTINCVTSIRRHILPESYEIIVVDNRSRQEEQDRLKDLDQPGNHVIYSNHNTGFGTGNMIGACYAKGDYLCFLNSDVILVEDCITPLCQYLSEHNEVGCITPMQKKPDGQAARSFRHDSGIIHELIGDGIREKLFPKTFPSRDRFMTRDNTPISVMQINGSFMLLPTSKFWAVGGFDTNLFLYFEEYDLCKRLSFHGWTSVVHPQYQFLHIHGASTATVSQLAQREHYISKIYIYRKYHHPLLAFIYQTIICVEFIFKPSKWYLLPTVSKANIIKSSMRHTMI